MNNETRRIHERLHAQGNLVSLDWISQCVEYLREEGNISEDKIVLGVQEQWLVADISTPGIMEKPWFPPNLTSIQKMKLSGKGSVQVNYGYDIGNPAYGQLQKIHKLENANARVSAENSEGTQSGYQPSQGRFVASWEPSSSRMLSLSLTDGFQEIQAVEHERVGVLPNMIPPGLKIELIGPILCRRGKLLLTQNSVRILGGEVEELQDRFSTENVLTQKIGTKIDKKRIEFPKPGVVRPGLTERRPVNINPSQTNLPSQNIQVNHQPRPTNNQPISKPNTRPINQPRVQENRSLPQNTETLDDVNWGDDDFPAMDDDDFPMMDDDDDLLLSMSDNTFQPVPTSVNISNTSKESSMMSSRPQHPYSIRPQVLGTQNNPPFRSPFVSSGEVQSRPNIPHRPPFQKSQPVARISPLTIEPCTVTPKKTIQTSIHSFLKPKRPRMDIPDFDLEDDLEIFDQVELPTEVEAKLIPSEPFVYLSELKKEMKKNSDRRYVATIRAVSSTLAGSMKIKKTAEGPQWFIQLVLNDGSDFIQAELSSRILELEIGSAASYAALKPGDTETKMKYREKIKRFSMKIAALSALVNLRFPSEAGLPVIESIDDISGIHLAKLRRRKL